MGDNRDTADKEEIEPESSKTGESSSHDGNVCGRVLRSVTDNMPKTRSAETMKRSCRKSSVSNKDTLKICRPTFVKLVRLPDSVVTKRTAVTEMKTKKRTHCRWRNGFADVKNKRRSFRKLLQKQRLQEMKEKAELLRSLEPGVDVKNTNDVEKSCLNEISGDIISNGAELATREASPSEKFDLSAESTAVKENAFHKAEEFSKVSETIVEERIASKSTASKSIVTTEAHDASLHKPDRRNCPKISDKNEIRFAAMNHQEPTNAATIDAAEISSKPHKPNQINCPKLVDKIDIHSAAMNHREPSNAATIDAAEISSKPHKPNQINCPKIVDKIDICSAAINHQDLANATTVDAAGIYSKSSLASTEQNNNQNRNICLQKLFDRGNHVNNDLWETRKRYLQLGDYGTGEPEWHPLKKLKPSNSAETSEVKDSVEVRNCSESTENAAPIAKQTTPIELGRCVSRFVRRRRKPAQNNIFREARVVLCRLEDSQDPLALKWSAQKTLEPSNDVTVITRRTSRISNRLTLEESSEIGTVGAGVPIASHQDPSEMFDAEKRVEESQKTFVDAISKDDVSTLHGDEFPAPIALEEWKNSQDDDDDDDEIMHFLSRKKSARSTIDSSSSTSSSGSEEIVSTRVLRSKTPLVRKSYLEKLSDCDDTRKTSPLRVRARSTIDSSSSTTSSSSEEITITRMLRSKTPLASKSCLEKLPHHEDTRKTPPLCVHARTVSPKKKSREETRRTSSVRRKSFDSTLNANKDCSALEEETSNSTLTPACNSQEESEWNLNENETRVTDGSTANGTTNKTSNFVTYGHSHNVDVSPEILAEANFDFSATDAIKCCDRNEVLMARRKLTALKNAMVVLTRLEDLEGLTDEDRYPGDDIEFRTPGDFEFSMGSTPDPLEINRDDRENTLRDNENNMIPFLTRDGSKKAIRTDVNQGTMTDMQEPDVEFTLRLEDASSQGTTESDVEMTLVFEEISSQGSDAESSNLQNDNRKTRYQSESPEVAEIDTRKAAESQNDEIANSIRMPFIKSVRSLRDDISTDANSNSGDSRNATVHGDEDIGERWKRCPCEEHQTVTRRVRCQNASVPNGCITCQGIFKDADTLQKHKSSSAVCNVGFLCTDCQATFVTLAELTKHRVTCTSKETQKQSLNEVSTNEKNSDSQNPPQANVEQPSTKANQKKQPTPKNQSKKARSKNRSQVENPICSVCSINFATTQALSEHIFTHSPEELQEAYRIAKAKALEDSQTSNATSVKRNEKTAIDQTVDNNASVEENRVTCLPQDISAEIAQPIVKSVVAGSGDLLIRKSAAVCLCHRDKYPARPDKTDLQIEMVLFCQQCMVIFRRRECFEIHYRTSPQCANVRARGRSPKLYCANCQITLSSWAGMRRHLEVHESLNVEGTVRFVCNICRVVFVGFGALFCNHWSNHLKDTMFVASRYSFPKNSVQPIEGIPILPIGAAPNEIYIVVAEHVCSNCKKTFSTKRELGLHEKSKICVESNDSATTAQDGESQWYCDVCTMTFAARRGLNYHSKQQHSQRYLCVATSPTFQAFMCTRCFAMKKTVRDIEDHWRSQPQHDIPLNLMETMAKTKRFVAIEDETDNANKSKNDSSDTLKPRANVNSRKKSNASDKDTPVIDIADDVQSEIDRVFQAAAKTPKKHAARFDNRETTISASSTSSSGQAATPNDTSMLRNLLGYSPMSNNTTNNEQQTITRTVEDPGVNAVLPQISKINVSAKLVIDENVKSATDEIDKQPRMDSYEIIMTGKSVPGDMKMVLGRTSAARMLEKNATTTTAATVEANDEETTSNFSNRSTVTTVSASELGEGSMAIDPLIESTVIKNANTTMPDVAGAKKSSRLSKTSAAKESDLSLSALLKNQPPLPEIIDIADEKEPDEARQTATVAKASKPKRVVDKINVKTITSNKSGVPKVKTISTRVSPTSKKDFPNDSGTSSHSETHSFSIDTNDMSFEELRLAYLMKSKQMAVQDSAGVKKPGFLRVKNLSELQPVKTHNCQTCNAAFESYASLEEHHQVHLCASTGKVVQCPKGMTAALILPDNSKPTPPQALSTVYTTGNVVTQQLIGLDSGLGVISGVPVSSVIVNNETAGSWIAVSNQHEPMSSVALVNTTHSLSGGTLLMNLDGQQPSNNGGAIMATSIATSTATIAQTQEILAVQQQKQQQQQQQQQQHQRQQQQLGDNSNRQLGFHVLPAMVLPPTAQTDKQQYNDNALRHNSTVNLPYNGQTNNVPFSYHSDKPNRYLCNICTTFRCNTIGTMNSHLLKHYTGFHNTNAIQNSTQPPTRPISNPTYLGTKEGTPINGPHTGKPMESNSNSNPVRNNWFVRNTPQGFVWVTSLSSVTNQQPGSSVVQDNNQTVDSSLSQQAEPTVVRGGQLVYRCLICKSAFYKAYAPLHNHVVLVHGITDLVAAGLENIVQKIYLCTHCPHGTVMYETEEALRRHLSSCHGNICPTCGRAFATILNLKTHVVYCTVPSRNASDNC